MSTNVSFSGISLKIPEAKTNKESIIEMIKFLKLSYTEKEIESLDDDFNYENVIIETKKNMWRVYRDWEGTFGLIYLTDAEYDVFDLEYKISLETVNKTIGELFNQLPQEYLNMDANDVNAFAYLYYNGSDNPFTF